jgi:alpha-glucosidase (family GH31 glycosyl hydrolase)
MTYTNSFPIHFDPIARPEAIATAPGARFTVLTPRLLRLEYSPNGRFEDRPSQAFWYRRQPVPEFSWGEENGRYHLRTAFLHLEYTPDPAGFSGDSLTIRLKESGVLWRYGQSDPANLRGTTRTLDEADGPIQLEEGLLSRSGWAVYDDTRRLVFDDEGWLELRRAPAGYRDLYFFGHGHDYAATLADFARVAGPAPMIPRWALGNWWSRYWAYSADELLALMDEFTARETPLAVCIVDMDWHITDTGNQSSGWTGYTWNRALFPDPPAFIAELHRRGLKTALNLHPAEGIHPHEAQYPALARALDLDPDEGEPIPFNIVDPDFARPYFELLHHPQEADGVDFWWMDWQQGELSGLPGLDPLWWLNHLHFYDLARDGGKRPFVFSRWGGLGNHRYPIGFSGDTVVSWASLAFQPRFTATAANVNYGWWSHDIGGHMFGVEEAELYLRWVQFGLFSPILRLHSTKNRFHERRPWGYDAETERLACAALRLRHAFIPYLYTMAWHNHIEHCPLVRPLYHDYPTHEAAYHCPDQYSFGSELLVAPFISPMDPDTRQSRVRVWLPPGDWFDFFRGDWYAGESWTAVYGGLSDIPVFAKAGAIVPLAVGDGLANPALLVVHLFPGADNTFALYEDDGLTGRSLLPLRQHWSPEEWTVTIGPVGGETDHLPERRAVALLFRGMMGGTAVSATLNGQPIPIELMRTDGQARVMVGDLRPADELTVTLTGAEMSWQDGKGRRLENGRRLVSAFRLNTLTKQGLYDQLPDLLAHPDRLKQYEKPLTPSQYRALREVLLGVE